MCDTKGSTARRVMDVLADYMDVSGVDEAWLQLFADVPRSVVKDVAVQLMDSAATNADLHILPPRQLRLHCFRFFHPRFTRVVLLGVEPPLDLDDCVGLSFSVPGGARLPTHLKMMFKELRDDMGQVRTPRSGSLTWWAQQGVLLLNSSLTSVEGLPNAHVSVWAPWTSHVLQLLSERYPGVVYILWGPHAQQFKEHIAPHGNAVLTGGYPNVASRFAFLGGRYFSRANEALDALGRSPVNWLLQ